MALGVLLRPENQKLQSTVADNGGAAVVVSDSTGNRCLDFFYHIVPSTPGEELTARLQEAWSSDPLTTLKLICNLRGVRGTGKSDKEGFYASALWLHRNHPQTLSSNVRNFVQFGYYKDLLEILYRLLEGDKVREISKKEWGAKKGKKSESLSPTKKIHSPITKNRSSFDPKRKEVAVSLYDLLPKDFKVTHNLKKGKVLKESARASRKEKNFDKAHKAYERYNTDSIFKVLYDCISDVFAESLKLDMKCLSSGEVGKISLASKWCPSLNSSYDRATCICESIARRIFPKESDPEYEGIEDSHYAFRVRDRLRKEVLVPLHKALSLPEVHTCSNQFDSLSYNKVSSVAMVEYKDLFLKHDNENFRTYLEEVTKGGDRIAAGALLPHEIIASLSDLECGKVAELQWMRMVEDLKRNGKLRNCIALCNVSEEGTLMEVAASLGLLISELSESPWEGKVISSSPDVQIQSIPGDSSLLSKMEYVSKVSLDECTNFQRVFDTILQLAVDGALAEDQMIRRVFVFSDSDFYRSSGYLLSLEEWAKDYEVVQRKFKERGFNHVPEVVFWNLKSSAPTPVLSNHNGVALISGFSKNLVKLFQDNGGVINPVSVMEMAISGELYQQLSVVD